MTEKYSNFDGPAVDKQPIIPEIRIKNWTFKASEFLLALFLIVTIIGIIILGVFLRTSTNEKNAAIAAARHSGDANKEICVSNGCLRSSAYIVQGLNKSVNPCDNFYQFACGNWATANPLSVEESQRDLFHDMAHVNQERIKKMVETSVSRADELSSERKLKHFFKSCTNLYSKDVLKGTPLISRLPEFGGWYVLNNFNNVTWNMIEALKKIQVDMWTNILFEVHVITDWDNVKTSVIDLHKGRPTQYYFFYTNPSNSKFVEDQKNWMREVARMMVRDANLSLTSAGSRIETFVNDVILFETKLANITNFARSSFDAFADEKRLTLNEVNQRTGNIIDFKGILKYAFNETVINDGTKVVVHDEEWLTMMSSLVANLGGNKSRILNNYFTWCLMRTYYADLSWDYVHSGREFYVDRYGTPNFLGTWNYCFLKVQTYMGEAMGSIFVRDHFSEENKVKTQEIVDEIKETLLNSLPNIKFMDEATKALARQKLASFTDKLGYPDFMMNNNKMDMLYETLKIDENNYFANLLSLNQFQRKDWNNRLKNGLQKSRWNLYTYSTYMSLSYSWNEIIVPAGLLQFPFYDHTLQHFMNFGSMGSHVAHYIVHMIDSVGRYFNPDGEFKMWWSNNTIQEWSKAKTCVENHYSNQTMGPFSVPGQMDSVTVPVDGKLYSTEGMAEISGVKIAYKAYQKWVQKNGKELLQPGIGLNNNQMFFVSVAQTLCMSIGNNNAYRRAESGRLTSEVRTNAMMSQVKEFSQEFKCPTKSPMNVPKKCDFYA